MTVKKQKHIKVPWVIVNDSTNKIKSCGISNCRSTFEAQPIPSGHSIQEYSGGIKGRLFIDGEMVL